MPGSTSTPSRSASGTPTTPRNSRGTRKLRSNPNFPLQPGFQATADARQRMASASSLPSSPLATPNTGSRDRQDGEKGEVSARFQRLEERVFRMEEELRALRDRLEESEWGRNRLEERLKENEALEGEVETLKTELKNERKERERQEEEIKKIVEMEKRKEPNEATEGERVGLEKNTEEQTQNQRYRCIIFTDSNGRGATADSVRNHIPREERDRYDIEIVVAYRVEDAMSRIQQGGLDVRGCYVVVDNLTNNVRGGWRSRPDSPEQLTRRVDGLRHLLLSSSAAAVVICQIKPMGVVDVRPYNRLLHQYLGNCGRGGFGCLTQIRMDFLRADGYHISPQYDTVLDRTYACALRGVPVPSPTPEDNFVPEFIRRRWEDDWPRLEGNVRPGHVVYHHHVR